MSEQSNLIARNIARFRSERGLSLSALARQTGLSKQTLSTIEQGRGNPTMETLMLISEGLGTSLRRLLTEWGTSVLVERADSGTWRSTELGRQRVLDEVYGSGYVRTWMLRLSRTASTPQGPRATDSPGTLLHLYVVTGQVRTGPIADPVELDVGDFVRFPADTPYYLEPMSREAVVHVVSTVPQIRQLA